MPLDADTRRDMESRFGADLGGVRVHADRNAASLATRFDARALSVGSDLVFGDGQYQPRTTVGRRLLAHELAHSVQGVPGRQEAGNPRLDRLRTLLDEGEEEDSIALMRELTRSESDQVLWSSAFQEEVVDTFDDEEMLRAVNALGGTLVFSLYWLFDEGNSWEDVRPFVAARTDGHADVRQSRGMRDGFVDLIDNDEMADLVDILGGDLAWKLEWMQEEGTSWSLIRAKLDSAPADQRLAIYGRPDLQELFVEECDNLEMAYAADKLGGTIVQKFAWVLPEGSDLDILLRWVRPAPLAERLSLYESGEAAAAAIEACDDDDMKVLVDAIGGSVVHKVVWLRAEGVFDYVPEEGETLPPPAPTAYTRPVVFGIEQPKPSDPRRWFVSVTVPGHSPADVAQYLYGTSDGALLGTSVPKLEPGTTLDLVPGKALSEAAQADLDEAMDTGTIVWGTEEAKDEELRSPEGQMLIYQFSAAGRAYQLTGTQMRQMLRGTAWRMGHKAEGIKELSETLRNVRNSHKSETNGAVRWISDKLGDVDLPGSNYADGAITAGKDAKAAFDEVPGTTSIAAGQEALGRAIAHFERASKEYAIAQITWSAYIRGTIEGAETAVTVLSVTRDLSFAIAAGLAGAVVAPLAFGAVVAAGGSTLVAGGTALVAGAGAGATLKGGLEFTGATGGQLAAEAVTPGEQEFDWSYVGERTWSGVKTGAGEGALGAVSHFQSAYLAARLGPAFAATTKGKMAIGAISGGATELAMSTGKEIVAPGPGGFSFSNIAIRTAVGAGGGAATSLIPIDGLYRVRPGGGVSFVPWRGHPVTPEWMIASPWHFVQPRGTAPSGTALAPRGTPRYAAVNNLRPEELPVLPEGYSWARVNGNEWAIVRPPGQPDIEVYAWDAGPGGRPYFTVRQAELGGEPSRMLYSEAVAGPTTRPQAQRQDPFPAADYVDPVTGMQFRRGHGVDHADTRAAFGPTDATGDPANFSPQTVRYNDQLRNQIVGWSRRNCSPLDGTPGAGAGPNPTYREVTYYGPNVQRTANPGAPGAGSGSAIPEGVYFIVADANGVPQFAWHVRTADAPTFATGAGSNAINSQRFNIPIDQVPTPVLWAAGFYWTGAGQVYGGARKRVEGEEGESP